ncbi:MAG: glycosyltransferase [Holophaga sp.]|nr:glycosyltransferase [Holophaga sp.]
MEVPSLGTIAHTPIAPTLMHHVRKAKPDLLHFHFPYPWGDVLQVLTGPKTPYIVSYHADIGGFRHLFACYKPFMLKFLKGASAIVVATSNHIESSPILSGELREKCVIVPFGLDLEPFRTTESLIERGRTYRQSLAGGGPLILFVGRLVGYKGLPTLLQAMKYIDATLVIAGEGPLRAQLQAEAKDLGIQDRVRWMGSVSAEELPSLYHSADLFVLPSDRPEEAFGLVQVEAHASSLPVVCCDLPTGVTKVNLHGETGLVVPLQDPRAMSEAINGLILDTNLRLRLGRQARDRAFREFSINTMCDRYYELYQKVMLERGKN